jgi:hypothetical protein
MYLLERFAVSTFQTPHQIRFPFSEMTGGYKKKHLKKRENENMLKKTLPESLRR